MSRGGGGVLCTALIDSSDIDFTPFIFMTSPSLRVSGLSHVLRLKLILIIMNSKKVNTVYCGLEGNLVQLSCLLGKNNELEFSIF